ncbi:hypothetical protein TNCV_841291 [Trichonephila clavipes]|nr:hypothetical protein TNCV_841291 [Trichonephila clavipes]
MPEASAWGLNPEPVVCMRDKLPLSFWVDNVCTAPIKTDKDISELVQISENTIDADSNDENEMYNAANINTSFEMRHIVKSMRGYLVTYFNGDMNDKVEHNE